MRGLAKLLAEGKRWLRDKLRPAPPPLPKHHPFNPYPRKRKTPGAFGRPRCRIRLRRALGAGSYSERDEVIAQMLSQCLPNARHSAELEFPRGPPAKPKPIRPAFARRRKA